MRRRSRRPKLGCDDSHLCKRAPRCELCKWPNRPVPRGTGRIRPLADSNLAANAGKIDFDAIGWRHLKRSNSCPARNAPFPTVKTASAFPPAGAVFFVARRRRYPYRDAAHAGRCRARGRQREIARCCPRRSSNHSSLKNDLVVAKRDLCTFPVSPCRLRTGR